MLLVEVVWLNCLQSRKFKQKSPTLQRKANQKIKVNNKMKTQKSDKVKCGCNPDLAKVLLHEITSLERRHRKESIRILSKKKGSK
jgi:hypothetical protein